MERLSRVHEDDHDDNTNEISAPASDRCPTSESSSDDYGNDIENENQVGRKIRRRKRYPRDRNNRNAYKSKCCTRIGDSDGIQYAHGDDEVHRSIAMEHDNTQWNMDSSHEEMEYDDGAHGKAEFVVIARNEFDIDKKVTTEYVTQILGDKVGRMSQGELKNAVDATAALKADVAAAMKLVVERKMIAIADRDPNIKDSSFGGLQKAWGKLNKSKDRRQVEMLKKSFWEITKPGASVHFPTNWDVMAEQQYMYTNKIKYMSDGTSLDQCKGCIGKMAGQALRSARKKLFYKATIKGTGHGYKISANKTGIRGTGLVNNQTRKRDVKFKDEYFRRIVSNVPGDSNLQTESSMGEDMSEMSDVSNGHAINVDSNSGGSAGSPNENEKEKMVSLYMSSYECQCG
jgi:hypothetical protein